MKKIIVIFTLSALFAACKNNSLTDAALTNSENSAVIPAQNNAVQERVVYVNSNTNTAQKKKGMSKAAKGAIIGGATGAVTVGVITKSGKGAIIGGILGAGTGYIIGRKKDKKDGRVN